MNPTQGTSTGVESFFAKIEKLSKVQRILIFSGVFIAIIVIFVFLLYKPKLAEISKLDEQLKALEKKKQDRYQNACGFVDDLTRFSRGDRVQAPSSVFRQHKVAATVFCMIALGLIVVLVVLFKRSPKPVETSPQPAHPSGSEPDRHIVQIVEAGGITRLLGRDAASVQDRRRCIDRRADDSRRAGKAETATGIGDRGVHATLLDGVAAAAHSGQGVTVEVFAHFQVFDHHGQSLLRSGNRFKSNGALLGVV